ncbi:MAG: hypothetical protein Q8P74_01975, partial [bacterium]|nr:hypothetical protein [bacterium]
LRIKCHNHKSPFENIIGWTTEFEDIIKCQLCGEVIYDPFLTAGTLLNIKNKEAKIGKPGRR